MSDRGELQLPAVEFPASNVIPARSIAANCLSLALALFLAGCSGSNRDDEQAAPPSATTEEPPAEGPPAEIAEGPVAAPAEIDSAGPTPVVAEPQSYNAPSAAQINPGYSRRPARLATLRRRVTAPPPAPPMPPPPNYGYSAPYAGPPSYIVRCHGELGSVAFVPGSAELDFDYPSGNYQTAVLLAENVANCGPGRASITGTAHAGAAALADPRTSDAAIPVGSVHSRDAGQLTIARADRLVEILESRTDPLTTQLAQILVTIVPDDPAYEPMARDDLQISFTPICPAAQQPFYSGTFGPEKDLPAIDPQVIASLAASDGLIVIAGYLAGTGPSPALPMAAPYPATPATAGSADVAIIGQDAIAGSRSAGPANQVLYAQNPPILDIMHDVAAYLASADSLQGRMIIKRDYGPDCVEMDQPGRITVFTEPVPARYLPPAAAYRDQPRGNFTSIPVIEPIPE